jgi:hypothetical protein
VGECLGYYDEDGEQVVEMSLMNPGVGVLPAGALASGSRSGKHAGDPGCDGLGIDDIRVCMGWDEGPEE